MLLNHNFYLLTVFAGVAAYFTSQSRTPSLGLLSRRIRSAILPETSLQAHELRRRWGTPHRDVQLPGGGSAGDAPHLVRRDDGAGYNSFNAFQIATPNTNSVWFVTTTATIQWQTIPGNVSKVSLKLYRGTVWGTSYFDDIAFNLPVGSTSYSWSVPTVSISTGASLLGDYFYQILVVGYDSYGVAMVNEKSPLFRIGGVQINSIGGSDGPADPARRTAGNSYLVSYDSWAWGELAPLAATLREPASLYAPIAGNVSNGDHSLTWAIPLNVEASSTYRVVLSTTTAPKDPSAGSVAGQAVTASFAAPVFRPMREANANGYYFALPSPTTVWNVGVSSTVALVAGADTTTLYDLALYSVQYGSPLHWGRQLATSIGLASAGAKGLTLVVPGDLPTGKYFLVATPSGVVATADTAVVSAVFAIVGSGGSTVAAAVESVQVTSPQATTSWKKNSVGSVAYSLSNVALATVNVTLYLDAGSNPSASPTCSPTNAVLTLAVNVKATQGIVTTHADPSWPSSSFYHVRVSGFHDHLYLYGNPNAASSVVSGCSSYFIIEGADESLQPASSATPDAVAQDSSSGRPTASRFLATLAVILAFSGWATLLA